ncbi:LCP family protein [Ihubacter massiliensis]|uniref:LCP family protein n=1 Tax=Hominibacterium faecale TaxID=2839743 RepID=A0A9J6QNG3_9FIRM|nr:MULTISPECIES: LCP family protein [Eubacteriales Family XIII. Incertae Sedis]MCO7123787.1 LCP family protein [Ihubacter massiliensis]MCU7378713.1 LCP family protein [Hominibacterium faecale]
MRSDKYSGKRDSSRDTQSYDGWEETQMLFQSRDQEKEAEKKRRQREAAYQEYLALRENTDASRAPEDDVRTYTRKKRANKQQSSVFEEPKPSRREKKEQKKPPAKKKKKKGRSLRRVILIVLLLLIAAAAAGILFVMGLMEKVGTEEIDQANLGINPQVEHDLKNYQNIALLGVDARDMEDYKTCRTDAIIMLSIDKQNKAIRQISVYRDTYLHANKKYGYDKITNVHAYAGTTGTLHSLNENMDLNIREAVIVNWKAVADAIDGLGGIDVEIKKSEIKEMNKYIKDTQKNIGGSKEKIKKAGMQTLNGNQAVTYARIRKDSSEGDYRRNERMKIVVSAAVDKAKKTNPFKLKQIADQVMPQIRTNMDTNSLLKVMFAFLRYDMTDSAGWPFETGSWTSYNGAWVGPPVTLKRNVTELHEKYFGQPGYEPTQTVQDISKEISRRTGLY